MALDLQDLCQKVEDCYDDRSQEGKMVFASWGTRGFFWSVEDYKTPGFAFNYTAQKFYHRAEGIYELLEAAFEGNKSLSKPKREL